MIKGVNRQIVEVLDTGNDYFEKALLFVRPRYVSVDSTRLHEEAQRLIRRTSGYSGLKINKRRNRVRTALIGSGFGLAGAAIGAVAMLMFRG